MVNLFRQSLLGGSILIKEVIDIQASEVLLEEERLWHCSDFSV